MNRLSVVGAVFVLCLTCAYAGFIQGQLHPILKPAEVSFEASAAPICDVRFSPKGGCQDEIMRAIGSAKKQIRVLAFSFTSEPIAQSLVLQAMAGVDVQVVMDSDAAKRSEADHMAKNGVKVYLDNKHAIMHNKVVIIDEDLVLTGSFNFSKSAEERNAENLVIIKSPQLAKRYLEDWEKHRQHSPAKAVW